MELEKEVQRLRAENDRLRVILSEGEKIGDDENCEQRKAQLKDMEKILSKTARAPTKAPTDQQRKLQGLLSRHKQQYAEYGSTRKGCVRYHMDQLKTLLLPTQARFEGRALGPALAAYKAGAGQAVGSLFYAYGWQ